MKLSNIALENTDAPQKWFYPHCKQPGHKGQEFLWTKVPKAQPSELKLHSVTIKYVFF